MITTLKKPSRDDQKFYEDIEHALLYLGMFEKGIGVPDPTFFDGAALIWKAMLGQITGAVVGRNRDNRAFDAASRTLDRLDASMLFGSEDPNHEFTIMSIKALSYDQKAKLLAVRGPRFTADRIDREVRHRFTPMDRIAQSRMIAVGKDGRANLVATGYASDVLGVWMPLTQSPLSNHQSWSMEDVAVTLGIALGVANRKVWNTTIRFALESPSIRLYTDPTGIKHLFAAREAGEGRTRRAALVHWVTEHWRQDRHDPDVEVYVRKHLRGQRSLVWHGLGVDIHVPPTVQEEAQRLQAERTAMERNQARRSRDRALFGI